MTNNEIYANLNLIISDLYIILQPDTSNQQHALQSQSTPVTSVFIDRNTLQIEARSSDSSPILSGTLKSCTKIFGCLGIIRLLSSPYIICISECEKIGTIRKNQVIHKVAKTMIIPIASQPIPLSEEEKREEKNYLSYLTDILYTFDFYYSYTFDITQSEQRISAMEKLEKENPDLVTKPLWERADRRFFWNYYLQKDFIENSLHNFILPIVDGFIKVTEWEINTNPFKYILISRRSCKRTGTRFQSRGVDPLGHVANFVETEQIIVFDQVLTSFVQVRGSIPIIWQQKGKGLKPKPTVENSTMTDESFQRHMNELIELYGPGSIVNLIDQIGGEASIGDQFEMETSLYQQAHQLHYTAFDFHEKCKNNKYENLQELLEQVKPLLDKFGYLFKSVVPTLEPSMVQTGHFRTNCVDCLDRTNVVQSLFARYILHIQLMRMGIISSTQKIDMNLAFETEFKNIWADNADVMSQQYTGTGALKTDYTRTGKRSMKGTMTDGVNSVKRYIHKNFKDDDKQVAIDLFLGKFQVEKFTTSTGIANNGAVSLPDSESQINEFPVEYIDEDLDAKGDQGIIKLTDQCSIITWVKFNGRKSEYRFKNEQDIDILFIEKSKMNHKLLNLYHRASPEPIKVLFSSSFTREQFLQSLYKRPLSYRFLPICEQQGKDYIEYLEKEKVLKVNQLTKDFLTFSDDDDDDAHYDQDGNERPKLHKKKNVDNGDVLPETTTSSSLDQKVEEEEEEESGIKFSPPSQKMKHKLLDMFNSFIGSWNMENITLNSTFVANWIPKNKDFYSISAQRIASYKLSPGFVMNYKQYWFYLIRQYLGHDYTTVATATTDNTASIVLVRKSLINSVNNISVSYIQKRLPFKKSLSTSSNANQTGQNSPQSGIISETNTSTHSNNTTTGLQINSKEITTSASTQTTNSKDSNNNNNNVHHTTKETTTSTITSVTNFLFGSKKLKDYGQKLMGGGVTSSDKVSDQKLKDMSTQIYGTTITLQLRDTSICFVNYCNNTPTTTFSNTPLVDDENGLVSFIKNKQYLNGSTRYIFWSGDYDQSTLQKYRWTPSCDHTKLHDDEPGRGVIYWKSLMESEPLLESLNSSDSQSTDSLSASHGDGTGSPGSSNVYIYPPLSFNYSLPVLSPYSWLSIQDIPCFIVIKDLYCEPFELIPSGTKLEAFIEFNASHLICEGDSANTRTSIIRSPIPIWNDKIELRSFIDDKEYLKTQYIQVAIFNRELMDQSVIGKGSIPLLQACGEKSHHFKIPLTLQDEFSCYLHGEIQVYSKSEIYRMVQDTAMSQTNSQEPPPPIPSRSNRQHRSAPSPPISNPSPNGKSPVLSYKSPNFDNISSSPTDHSHIHQQQQQQSSTPTKSSFLDNLTKSVVDNIKVPGEFLLNSFSGTSTPPSTTSVSDSNSTSTTLDQPIDFIEIEAMHKTNDVKDDDKKEEHND
ncbi:hypothetical protein DLAC_00582 [Tieghemostelium lacteum]|uniref:phosphoinositide 5-phosphatase n=1 Tax=Tieghemostelium lacteum TaxID=361077 RepID=A0A152AA45_TIELA|nr:hypothetical protein DLAC_00582 [Tieghemostelium lacteum]|eukprot:KYR03090.1 hypothetical protein DLAC_00582 [Tieghemostelium lacteum]